MRWTALIWALPLLLSAVAAQAQNLDELEDLDEGVVLEEPFERGIQPNSWGLVVLFGYRNVSNTLLEANGIVVDVEFPDEASFADMKLEGAQSFSPQVRLTRTLGRNFGIELGGGFSLGDFQQTITSDLTNWVDPEGNNTVTPTELQKGSYWIWSGDLSAVWYPRGEGAVQPYLIGGGGVDWFDIDSVYIDGATTSTSFSYGIGLKLVGDELYSIRLEARNYHVSLDHNVARSFRKLPNLSADALIEYPVSRLVNINDLTQEQIDEILASLDLDNVDPSTLTALPVPYEGFDNQSFTNLWFSLGFEATF